MIPGVSSGRCSSRLSYRRFTSTKISDSCPTGVDNTPGLWNGRGKTCGFPGGETERDWLSLVGITLVLLHPSDKSTAGVGQTRCT